MRAEQFRVQGVGVGVQGLGFRVQGLGLGLVSLSPGTPNPWFDLVLRGELQSRATWWFTTMGDP